MTGALLPHALLDQEQRDRIVHRHHENLFVDAGAGTGKTKQLVDRIVAMVATGHLRSISGLAAITFTENAATELRTRIREALEAAADPTDSAMTADERGRCRVALGELDDAAVTTLHGYAARMLLDAPLEAGLPPGFQVHDAVRTSIDRDVWWRALLDEWYAEPALAEVWRVGLTLDLKPQYLREVLAAFDANWDLLVDRPIALRPLPTLDAGAVLRPLQQLLAYAGGRGPHGDRLTRRIDEELAPLIRDATNEVDPLQVLATLVSANFTAAGKAGAWKAAGLDKAAVSELLDEAERARDALLAACREAVTTTLAERLRRAVLTHADQRRDRGELWFHDLLVYATRLLRDDADVRAAMRERWQVVCVDEFQDTDPLQVELVHLIAGLDEGDWATARVDGGRLFFVGDPKQSIYRFRRAEVGLFAQVRDRYDGGRLRLTQNFRSRPGILDAVNAVFDPLLGGDPTIGYQPLHAARAEVPTDPGPDVLLLGGPSPAAIAKVREIEAEHLAVTLRRARGSWLVSGHDETRPATYGDMAILVPTRTSLGQLEDALDRHGVPYRIMSRSLVWESDAVRDLVTVLQAVDDPADAVAVVAALRHPMFACSDDDLVGWQAAGGSWRFDAPPPSGAEDSPVAAGMATLRRYHELRWWLPVNGLLDRIIRERRAVELTAVHGRPRDHWRRLRFLVDQARLFLDSGGTGLTAFLRWAQEQIASAADAVETVTPERDDDAVQILTIHGAKGLEFPVVALTGINAKPRSNGHVVWPRGDAPEVRLYNGFTTAGHAAAQQADQALDRAEDLRLLYVGMTRAADHLIVSLHHKSGGRAAAGTHAARLYGMLDVLHGAGAVHELAATATAADDADGTPPTEGSASCLADRAAFGAERQRLIAAVVASLPTTATGLVAAAEETQEPVVDDLAAADGDHSDRPVHRPVARSSGATLGSAVHRALELVDLGAETTSQVVAAAAAAACSELDVAALADEVARRVRAALAAPIVQEAARRPHWKEVPIVATLDGRVVEGFIDLLVDAADGLVVIDYKTDTVRSPADVEAKTAHYAPQLRAYARAVASATGRPVARALLLFCGRDDARAAEVAVTG